MQPAGVFACLPYLDTNSGLSYATANLDKLFDFQI